MKKLVLTACIMLVVVIAFAQQNQEKTTQNNADSLRTAALKQAEQLRVYADSLRMETEKMAARMKEMQDTSKSKTKPKQSIVFDESGIHFHTGKDKDSSSDDGDSSDVKSHKTKEKKNKRVVTNYLRTDLGLNNYLYKGSLTLPRSLSQLDLNTGKSVNVNLHIFDQAVRLDKKGHLRFYYGVTVNYSNYRFTEDVTLNRVSDSLLVSNSLTPFKKNKLVTNYLTLPIGFRYESNPTKEKRSFRLSAGPTIGYLVGAHTKQVTSKGSKDKSYSDLNINKFAYGVNTSIGYGWFNLYMNYSLTPLFEKGKGPELTPVSFGIILNDFDF